MNSDREAWLQWRSGDSAPPCIESVAASRLRSQPLAKRDSTDFSDAHTEEWVYFLNQWKSLQEGNGTVLDHTFAVWGTTNGGPAAHSKEALTAILIGGSRLGIKHAGHIPCKNQVPLGNLMRTITEKMGVVVNDQFYGGAHSGVIQETV